MFLYVFPSPISITLPTLPSLCDFTIRILSSLAERRPMSSLWSSWVGILGYFDWYVFQEWTATRRWKLQKCKVMEYFWHYRGLLCSARPQKLVYKKFLNWKTVKYFHYLRINPLTQYRQMRFLI